MLTICNWVQLFFMILVLQEVMTICTGRVTQAVAALEARGSVNGAGVLAKVSNILLVHEYCLKPRPKLHPGRQMDKNESRRLNTSDFRLHPPSPLEDVDTYI